MPDDTTDAQSDALSNTQIAAGIALAHCPVTTPAEACELLTIALGGFYAGVIIAPREQVEALTSGRPGAGEALDVAMIVAVVRGFGGDPCRDVVPSATEA